MNKAGLGRVRFSIRKCCDEAPVRPAAGGLKNNRGMTLVELIVSIVIFSVIVTSVTAILSSFAMIYIKINDTAETNAILDNISYEMLNDIRYACGGSVSEGELTLTVNTVRRENNEIMSNKIEVVYDIGTDDFEGLICRDGKPVLDRHYYKGKTASIEYLGTDEEEIEGNCPAEFVVKVSLLDKENRVISSRDYSVKPLGLNSY